MSAIQNKLTLKQTKFIDEYLIDGNATQAAVRSGYSERSARNQANRMMKNDDILEEIKNRKKAVSDSLDLKKEDVISELAKGAFAKIDLNTIKFSDKIKCLELLSKYFNLLDGTEAKKTGDKSQIKRRLLEAVASISK